MDRFFRFDLTFKAKFHITINIIFADIPFGPMIMSFYDKWLVKGASSGTQKIGGQ